MRLVTHDLVPMTARTTLTLNRDAASSTHQARSDGPSRTWIAILVLAAAASVLLNATAMAEDPPPEPDLDRGLSAWLTLRSWLDDGAMPPEDRTPKSLEVPGCTAAAVLLRLDGRVIGRGFAPEGRPADIRRAFGQARAHALGDRVVRGLPEPWRSSPGSRITLELELAGPRVPLVAANLAAAAARIEAGCDGVAIVRSERHAVELPGMLLSLGLADGKAAMLIRLLGEVGLPPRDLPELRRLDTIRLERCRTLRLGQSTPGDLPSVRRRAGPTIPRVSLEDLQLRTAIDGLTDRLHRWRAPVDPDSRLPPDSAGPYRGWLGPYDPISRSHRPVEAPITEGLLAHWALAECDDAPPPVPLPETLPESSRERADVADLALLATGSTGDEVTARRWLDQVDSNDADELRSDLATSARHAAALGRLPEDVVSSDRFDEAYQKAWDAATGLPDIAAEFDWLALMELAWWRRHGTPGPRLDSVRAAGDALLLRQLDVPGSDRDGAIALRRGLEDMPDARNLRPLLGFAALQLVPDEDPARSARFAEGLSGLVRFARQLLVTPEESGELPDGRTAVWGVQRDLADRSQPLAATATALLALRTLLPATTAATPTTATPSPDPGTSINSDDD